jgi:predicted Zn-dependent protease
VPDAAPHGEAAGALIERGNGLARQRRVIEALAQVSAARALQPERFDANVNPGVPLLAANRSGEAGAHLRRVLAQRPERVPLRVALGQDCAAQGYAAEAESCFTRAFAPAPDGAKVLAVWTGLFWQRGRFAQAASACVCCAAA